MGETEKRPVKHPLVIWTGKQPLHPKSASRFRLVDRGPAREGRPDEVPFSLERLLGADMMKQQTWVRPTDRRSCWRRSGRCRTPSGCC